MNLKTFVERFEGYDLGRDQAKISADLRRLATHKTLLSEHLYQTLQRDGYSTRNSLYNAYAFVLHSSDVFSVRLSFWAPVTRQDESETFIYHLNHPRFRDVCGRLQRRRLHHGQMRNSRSSAIAGRCSPCARRRSDTQGRARRGPAHATFARSAPAIAPSDTLVLVECADSRAVDPNGR